MPKPTIVLVHGAWADGSSWNAVSTELHGQGFTVQTPPNLLHGRERRRLRRLVPGPAHDRPGRPGRPLLRRLGDHERRAGGGDVKALVYVDAFIPDEGETVFQILGGSGSALDIPDPSAVLDIVGYPGAPEGDAEAFLKPDTVHESFAQDLPEADRWLIVASQRPITLSANTTGSGAPAWKTIPSWAVIGTEDRVIPPATQRQHGRARGRHGHRGRRIARLDGLPPRGCPGRHPGRRRHHRRPANPGPGLCC